MIATGSLPRRLLLAGLAVAGLLGSAPRAWASCPPLATHSSFFEWLVRHTQSLGPLSDLQIADLAKKEGINPLLVSPRSGPAPLTVEIRWWTYPVADPVHVEFDADGNGVPEWSQPRFESVSRQQSYTYQREGEYRFTARVRDRSGQITVYTTPIKVLSGSAFDADLQARWAGLKAALRRGDIPAALECLHSGSRDRYRESFTVLSGGLPQETDQILTAIRLVEHRRAEAIYEMLRTDAGIIKSFEVRFQVDGDGVWRVRSF